MSIPYDPTAGLPCWLDVDLDAIRANVAALRHWVSPRTRIAAVVKADAYGVGAEAVARVALDAGASWLAVARVHEATQLRAAGIGAPILVMNRTDVSECEEAVSQAITVTVDCAELGHALACVARRLGVCARAHVKVDTGLHRFGVSPGEALALVDQLAALDGLELEGLYTHFASADEPESEFTSEQLARFEAVTGELARAGHRFALRHAANSAATLTLPAAHLDLVRVGLSIYGASPLGAFPAGLRLRAALALRARLARIAALEPGDTVGYGQTWRAAGPARVGLLTAGYADGIPRRAGNRGAVLVRGQRAPIIGRISMDQTTIDLTRVAGASVSDAVTLFGRDAGAELSLWEFARGLDAIPYDVLTGIGGRVARVYRTCGSPPRIVRLNGTVPAHPPAW